MMEELPSRRLSSQKAEKAFDTAKATLAKLTPKELMQLRGVIDSTLNINLDLGSLNLAEELALQYHQGKILLNDVQGASDVPANQRAQVFSAIRTQLGDIIKQQEVVWSMERQKRYEAAFVKCSGMLPLEARQAFFAAYSDYMKDPTAPGPA